MFENPFKRSIDESILTDMIFEHCENITEYDYLASNQQSSIHETVEGEYM